jgi:hypothetical protein
MIFGPTANWQTAFGKLPFSQMSLICFATLLAKVRPIVILSKTFNKISILSVTTLSTIAVIYHFIKCGFVNYTIVKLSIVILANTTLSNVVDKMVVDNVSVEKMVVDKMTADKWKLTQW